jgi:hypothetical protein
MTGAAGQLSPTLCLRRPRGGDATALATALSDGLDAAARRLEGKPEAGYAPPEAAIAAVRRELSESEAGTGPAAADPLIGRIVTDIGALYAASAGR